MNPKEYLEELYSECMEIVGSDDFIKSELDEKIKIKLSEIVRRSENSKGVLAVLITSLVYKKFYPDQDIRRHQGSIEGGYSGRTFDSKYITPFLKDARFPHMAESGWLTRSLEQKAPYNMDYKGAITPKEVKQPFLELIDAIENGGDLKGMLAYLLQGLIIQRNKQSIELAKPVNLPIAKIVQLLSTHFNGQYSSEGASRLPVLALYAAYQCLVQELNRFNNKKLQPIESHTSADTRSGRIGDIEVVDDSNKPFEAVEVKHGIQISLQLVKDAYNKFSTTQVKRFYLLSTTDVNEQERSIIEAEIDKIKNIHGCHVIANGVIKTLSYYLRLLTDVSEFISNYVLLLEADKSIKFEHKQRWNELVSAQ